MSTLAMSAALAASCQEQFVSVFTTAEDHEAKVLAIINQLLEAGFMKPVLLKFEECKDLIVTCFGSILYDTFLYTDGLHASAFQNAADLDDRAPFSSEELKHFEQVSSIAALSEMKDSYDKLVLKRDAYAAFATVLSRLRDVLLYDLSSVAIEGKEEFAVLLALSIQTLDAIVRNLSTRLTIVDGVVAGCNKTRKEPLSPETVYRGLQYMLATDPLL